MVYTYAHMCRDDHLQIGHNDSEHEQCPVCRAQGWLNRLINNWYEFGPDGGFDELVSNAHDYLRKERQRAECAVKR
jgi:hypothetical protein